MSELRQHLIEIVEAEGHRVRDEPFQLASGKLSHHFVDGKRALAKGSNLRVAGDAILEWTREAGIEFDAVGGLTNGADHLAHAVALQAGDVEWFFVRKEPKNRGTRQMIEGARITPGLRVLLVDDVVTTGGSTLKALEEVEREGAEVVGVVTLLDRNDEAGPRFAERGIPYEPMMTYRDLGMPPVRDEPDPAAAGASS